MMWVVYFIETGWCMIRFRPQNRVQRKGVGGLNSLLIIEKFSVSFSSLLRHLLLVSRFADVLPWVNFCSRPLERRCTSLHEWLIPHSNAHNKITKPCAQCSHFHVNSVIMLAFSGYLVRLYRRVRVCVQVYGSGADACLVMVRILLVQISDISRYLLGSTLWIWTRIRGRRLNVGLFSCEHWSVVSSRRLLFISI